ncbi:MAG: hypothetical protein V9F01_14255 [Chitinophagaceae bacterium]
MNKANDGLKENNERYQPDEPMAINPSSHDSDNKRGRLPKMPAENTRTATGGTGANKELLNGQTAKRRLVMIRSCFCIIVNFYKHLSSEGR